MKRSTLQQVAERACVSKMTASNVLRGHSGRTSGATRERVLSAARELRYIPMRVSLQNRRGATRTLGFVSDKVEWASEFESQTYSGVRNGCLHASYDLLLLLRSESDWVIGDEEMSLLDGRCDGLIFLASDIASYHQALEQVVAHGTPVVACYTRDVPDGVLWVDPDNERAMEESVAHLVALGHSRIAFWTTHHPGYDAVTRHQAFSCALIGRDLPLFPPLVCSFNDEEPNVRAIRWAKEQGITAFVCVNDWVAGRVWDSMRSIGLDAPRDFSLSGVDDWADAERQGLTSVRFFFSEVGRHAARLVIEAIEARPEPNSSKEDTNHFLIPVQHIARASTGRAPH